MYYWSLGDVVRGCFHAHDGGEGGGGKRRIREPLLRIKNGETVDEAVANSEVNYCELVLSVLPALGLCAWNCYSCWERDIPFSPS